MTESPAASAEAELSPLDPAQSVLYRFLTEAFRLPDAGRLQFLAEWAPLAAAAVAELSETGAAGLDTGPAPSGAALAAAVAAAGAMPLAALQGAYTSAFVSGHPTTPCRLLESVQREGQLIGVATEEAAMWYGRFGLAAGVEQADHLACELEFLAYLTGTPVGGREAERYRRARIQFVRQRVLPWVRGLAARIPAAVTVPLYAEAARLLDWLLAAETRLEI